MTIPVGSSGGLKPPTSLQNNTITAATAMYSNILTLMGSVNSAAITSATLTEVLNISGSGVLTLSAISTSSTATMTAYKITIVIDGVTVLSELSGGATTQSTAHFQVGAYSNATKTASAEGQVVFNTSLVVEIAGDGTNGAQYVYKRYLT